MKMGVLLASLLAIVALTGCSWGANQLDTRTGKPLPASPTSPREIGLRTYTVNLFGQYRVTHAYLRGINVSQCYAGAPDNDVQFVTMQFDNRGPAPAYVFYHLGKRGEQPLEFMMLGTKKTNGEGQQYMEFDPLCVDRIAGGSIALGIRDTNRQTITEGIDSTIRIAQTYPHAKWDGPVERVRNGQKWIYFHEHNPAIYIGDEWEEWYFPIGQSDYYFSLSFSYMSGARKVNTPEYQQARRLFEQILDSIQVEKLPS